MDYSRLDLVRRKATPVELDLVESFAHGRITRRQFIQRAAVIGLSASAVSMVIAACSSGTPSASAPAASGSAGASASAGASPSASGVTGGSIKVAIQRPVQIDPINMQDLGGYGTVAQCMEFLCTLDKNGVDIAPGLAESWTPNEDGSVWTFKLRSGVKWQDGKDFTADDVVATMGASPRLFCGRCASSLRTWSMASASSAAARCATPLRPVWTPAPPRDSASISSWVTAFTTLGPVTNM